MEAPDIIWLSPNEYRPNEPSCFWSESQRTDYDIEYVCKDSFIEKAVKWIEEINNHHHIMRYSDSCEPPLSELSEWFKNYMKGE